MRKIRVAAVLLMTASAAACGADVEPGAEGTADAGSGASLDADSVIRDATVTADTQVLEGDTAAP